MTRSSTDCGFSPTRARASHRWSRRATAAALDWFEVTLTLALGVNAVNAEDWPTAVQGYSRALAGFVRLELAESAFDCLNRIADVVLRGEASPDVAVELVRGIAPAALAAERLVGEPAAERIRRLLPSASWATPRATLPSDAAVFASEVAKGLRFATALYSGSRYHWEEDEHGQQLLKTIADEEPG